MGEVVQGEFGYKPSEIPGMPKSAPEVLNRLAVLAHDRNKAIKELVFAEKCLVDSQRTVDQRRQVVDVLDAKMREAHLELVEDIRRETAQGSGL